MKNERRFSDGYGNMFSNPADAGGSAMRHDDALPWYAATRRKSAKTIVYNMERDRFIVKLPGGRVRSATTLAAAMELE